MNNTKCLAPGVSVTATGLVHLDNTCRPIPDFVVIYWPEPLVALENGDCIVLVIEWPDYPCLN